MSEDVLYNSLSITVMIHFKCNEFLMIICLFHFLIWRFSDSSNHSYQNYDNSTDIPLLKFTSIVCNVYQIVNLFNCLYIWFIKGLIYYCYSSDFSEIYFKICQFVFSWSIIFLKVSCHGWRTGDIDVDKISFGWKNMLWSYYTTCICVCLYCY